MSDTQKIVRRHLEDPNHVITDEELRSIRIGVLEDDGRNSPTMKFKRSH